MRYLIVFIALMLFVPVTMAEDAVVYGVLYYSPTCPHCHEVIDNDVPEWEAEFGESFVLLYIDVTTDFGRYITGETCTILALNCGTVPMMVIGETAMWGSRDIPERAPQIIRDGLQRGGIDLPPVPELIAAYERSVAVEAAEATAEATAATEASIPAGGIATQVENPTWIDKFNADRTGNTVAVLTLVALILSAVTVLRLSEHDAFIRGTLTVLMVIAALFSRSLAVSSADDPLATIMSWGALGGFGISAMMVVSKVSLRRIIPVVSLAGLFVAIYLAQVEVAEVEAVCGTIGDCNAVQQSEYARLFGVLPIGVLGVAGYAGILVLWAIGYIKPQAQVGLFIMTGFGVLFSIYLTFLEPFVIGATCTWCITSAIAMMILLWLSAASLDSSLRDTLKMYLPTFKNY